MQTNSDHKQPNILFVIADDHRADSLSGDRTSGPATPTLDELRNNGVSVAGARIGGGHNPARRRTCFLRRLARRIQHPSGTAS